MKSRTRLFVLVALLLATAITALADVAIPEGDKPKKLRNQTVRVFMDIRQNELEKEPTLLISRDVVRKLSAQLDGKDASSQSAASLYSFSNPGGTQTMMAGIFLSLALAFGGVWLVHSRKQNRRLSQVALGLMVCALCGVSASLASANAGPPRPLRPLDSRILIDDVRANGVYDKVKVDLMGDGYGVVLDLPKK